MKRNRWIALGAMIILVAGAGPAGSTPTAPADTDKLDGLRVTSASATEMRASFGHSTTSVELSSRTAKAGSTSSTVHVNGKTVTARRNLVSGQASWSGSGAALTPAERAGLLSLSAKVSKEWAAPAKAARRALPDHTDLLLRLVMLVADAPSGVALGTYQADRPALSQETPKNFLKREKQSVTCVESALTATSDNSAARQRAVAACQQSDEEGIFYMACVRANRPLNHDSAGHCFIQESINSGPGSAECMGECGPGCNGIDTFTYDCGDHDRCGRVHGGSLNPWDSECGDEYFEADDDTLWAPINRC